MIGKVGGVVFPVGACYQGVPSAAGGVLYLGINDDNYGDNSGSFVVNIAGAGGGFVVPGTAGCATLPGATGWVATGQYFCTGSTMNITAGGIVNVNNVSTAGPAGGPTVADGGFCLGGVPEWSLIGRIGGSTFYVGAAYNGPSPGRGELLLAVNDEDYSDNGGHFDVMVGYGPCAANTAPGVYTVRGGSNGVAWTFAFGPAGAAAPPATFGPLSVPIAGPVPAGAGAAAIAAAFVAAAAPLAPGIAVTPGPGAASFTVTSVGPVDLWLSAAGAVPPAPLVCRVGVGNGCSFNPIVVSGREGDSGSRRHPWREQDLESPSFLGAVAEADGNTPSAAGLVLHQNYPNPLNPSTTIGFFLPQTSRAFLAIYTVKGELVRTLADGEYSGGEHALLWDGADEGGRPVTTGIYFYRLDVNGASLTKKLTVVK